MLSTFLSLANSKFKWSCEHIFSSANNAIYFCKVTGSGWARHFTLNPQWKSHRAIKHQLSGITQRYKTRRDASCYQQCVVYFGGLAKIASLVILDLKWSAEPEFFYSPKWFDLDLKWLQSERLSWKSAQNEASKLAVMSMLSRGCCAPMLVHLFCTHAHTLYGIRLTGKLGIASGKMHIDITADLKSYKL